MADNLVHPCNRRRVLTIDNLPDDVLLEIFDFYVIGLEDPFSTETAYVNLDREAKRKIESWQSLVHVCRRWRGLVFGSPRSLNLQLCFYIPRIFGRKFLDVWPTLPILILGDISAMTVGNVVDVLEHSDRIRHLHLEFHTASLEIKRLWTAMQVPFPELTRLHLSYGYLCGPVLPDSFLGGSALRLRYLTLNNIPFPGLLNLLLSATHLVKLRLNSIPPSEYISPEAMATCLSVLTNLETLQLGFGFESPQSYPDLKSRRSFPQTRSVLPTLTNFSFYGSNEYLEEFVARIDAPQLSSTTFFDDIDFDTPGLSQFISRAPTHGAYDEAHLIFDNESLVSLRQSHPERSDRPHRVVQVTILANKPDRQLSSLAQVCTLSLRLFLTMENLYIYETPYSTPYWMDNSENNDLLDLLLPFTAIKNLYLSKLFSPHIALVLQEITGGRTTEVLPALQNLLLEGFQPSEPVQDGFARFISARQLTNHPVTISVWDRDLVQDQM